MTQWKPFSYVLVAVCIALLWTSQPAVAQEGTSNVEIEVFTCPVGSDSASTLNDLAAACLEPADPVSITVGNGSTWAEGADTIGEAPQTVHFENVESGPIQVVESVPDGMAEPLVACLSAADGEYVAVEPYELPSDTFTFRAFVRIVAPGETLTCRIFHIPTGAQAEVDLPTEPGIHLSFKACPAGTAMDGFLETLVADCNEPLSTVSVAANGAGWMAFSGTTGTPGTPMELWLEAVRPGPVHLDLAADQGYTVGALFCGEAGGDPEAIPLDTDGVATVTFEVGAIVVCQVFMAPAAEIGSPMASPVASPIS